MRRMLALVRRVWAPVAVLVAIAGAFVLVAVIGADTVPTIVLRAQWLPATLPTAVAWYQDGSREDVTRHLATPWKPERPLRLVTLVAGVVCSIEVDGRQVSADQASGGRTAVCAWVAT